MERARAVAPGDKKVHRCKVDGCEADLNLENDYSKKHRACQLHRQALECVVQGAPSRWCQRCTKFHEVEVFESTKRSCRTSLHNLKGRRHKAKKRPVETDSEAEEPTGSCSQTSQDTTSEDNAPPAQPQPRPKRQVQQRQLWRHNSNESDATTEEQPRAPPHTLDLPAYSDFGSSAAVAALSAQLVAGMQQAAYAEQVQKAQKILQSETKPVTKPRSTCEAAGVAPEEALLSSRQTACLSNIEFAHWLKDFNRIGKPGCPTLAVPPSENSAAAEIMIQQRLQELGAQFSKLHEGQKRQAEGVSGPATERQCTIAPSDDVGGPAPTNTNVPASTRSTPFNQDPRSLPLGVFDLPLTVDVVSNAPPLTVDVTSHTPGGITANDFIISPVMTLPEATPATPGLSLVFPPASTSSSFVMPSLQPLDLETPPQLNQLLPLPPLDLPSWDRAASEFLDQALFPNTGGDHTFPSVLLGSQQSLGILC